MPTTTNFGWTTTADTDLVKDGAAAIRTLGNGIDTSLLDLKGGTTGQVLSKASNTDLDFSWVAQDDSNAIQNALLTTTGDTIYASSASTPARLGIGTTGQVLTVSGGVPTWSTPATPTVTFAGVRVYGNNTQTISNATTTDMTWNSETFDTDGYHSTSSNTDRLTVPAGKAGYYLVQGVCRWDTSNSNKRDIYLVKTSASTDTQFGISSVAAGYDGGQFASGVVFLDVGDYVRMQVYQNSGGNVDITKGSSYSYFAMSFLGA